MIRLVDAFQLHVSFNCSLNQTDSTWIYSTAPPPIPVVSPVIHPCLPSPCGLNAQCKEIGDMPSCSCLPGYIGNPPNCRPECLLNSECTSNLACIREKCRDPCPGSCGTSALCSVINHTPICTCPEGFTGDPFTSCFPKPPERRFIHDKLESHLI